VSRVDADVDLDLVCSSDVSGVVRAVFLHVKRSRRRRRKMKKKK